MLMLNRLNGIYKKDLILKRTILEISINNMSNLKDQLSYLNPKTLANFNSYQAKATNVEETEKEEEIFIDLEDRPEDLEDLEDQPEEEVKHEKMQNNNNNNFVEIEREE